MRLARHALSALALWGALGAAQPLVLAPEPLPSRFTDLQQTSDGGLLVLFGSWSEWGTARLSKLKLGRRWQEVPGGAAYEWGDWLVFDGLFPMPGPEGGRSPWDGGSRVVWQGTDDAFVRRVLLVHSTTGRVFEAPWDTLAPLPLGRGDTWLVWRCAQRPDAEEPLELLAWSPRTGRSVVVGRLPGDSSSCFGVSSAEHLSVISFEDGGFVEAHRSRSFAWQPVVRPMHEGALALLRLDGGAQWVQLDARGRVMREVVDAGVAPTWDPVDARSPLRPLRRASEAFIAGDTLKTSDGGVFLGGLADGGVVALTPSLGAGFAVFDGLLFCDEGVFRLPANAPAVLRP